jgi:hypothetical protein
MGFLVYIWGMESIERTPGGSGGAFQELLEGFQEGVSRGEQELDQRLQDGLNVVGMSTRIDNEHTR